MRKLVAQFLVLSATLVLCPVSVAKDPTGRTDRKVYPGSVCLPQDFSAPFISRTTSLQHFNPDPSSSISIVCPIIRDNTENLNGYSVRVWVLRQDDAIEPLFCNLASCDVSANCTVSNVGSHSGVGQAVLELRVSTSFKDGTYQLNCSLPSFSLIFGYQVREFLPTDR
jgi:hypothetical protein